MRCTAQTLPPSCLGQDLQWYLGCALLGLADAGFQSQAYTMVGRKYSGRSKIHAFSVFAVVQHVGFAAAWANISVFAPKTYAVFSRNMLVDGGLALAALAGFLLSRSTPVAP